MMIKLSRLARADLDDIREYTRARWGDFGWSKANAAAAHVSFDGMQRRQDIAVMHFE